MLFASWSKIALLKCLLVLLKTCQYTEAQVGNLNETS